MIYKNFVPVPNARARLIIPKRLCSHDRLYAPVFTYLFVLIRRVDKYTM